MSALQFVQHEVNKYYNTIIITKKDFMPGASVLWCLSDLDYRKVGFSKNVPGTRYKPVLTVQPRILKKINLAR